MKIMLKYLVTPFLTVTWLAIVELAAAYGAARAIAGVFVVFYIFAPASNIASNVAAWLILSGYCLYAFDPARAWSIIVAFGLCGLYDAQRNRRLLAATRIIEHTVNGNLAHLERIHDQAKALYDGWRCPGDPKGKEEIYLIADSLGDLRQKVEFWHQEAIAKKIVQEHFPIYEEV